MKKNFLALAFALLLSATASAQYSEPGYYRVRNATLSAVNKQEYYCWVVADYFQLNTSAGTGQSFESLALYRDEVQSPISAPATVIYATVSGSTVDLAAQGTSVSKMTSYNLTLTQQGTANSYKLSAYYSGQTLYLYPSKSEEFNHRIATTVSYSGYDLWSVDPITSDSETNYFGITPMLQVGGKYYQPFYAEFPFEFASSGMKAYYVDGVDTEHYQLKEITSTVKPGATPMLIECSSADPSDNRLELLHGSYDKLSDNKLSGVYFCSDYIYGVDGIQTAFDANTMRVWNVENGELVLSTSNENLHSNPLAEYWPEDYIENGYLNANQSYLTVSSTANATLTQGTTAVIDVQVDGEVTVPVKYFTLDGKQIREPVAGQGIVVVKYSDGSVKKMNY